MTRQDERRDDSCYGWDWSSAPSCGAGGKSRRVGSNGASGRCELGSPILNLISQFFIPDFTIPMERPIGVSL
jgi:hypothetical protein